ncbi:MAG TPA: Ig-like domain-containing protein [Thermoanaerobaculia bacterium]|nr:Ig-like domain-containing protein [Thermoanaerobaculia bacterium]
MRRPIIACCLLSLALGLASSADGASRAATTDTKAEAREKKPKANAGQGRRRAVRKTAPVGPVARADSYTILRGGTLTTDASAGVLANDTDPQAKPLTAILVSTTTQGTLTLNANGSFTYTNHGSLAASDSFTYKANNGTVDTTAAIVTITLTDPAPEPGNDSFATGHDSLLTVPPPGVLANDTTNNAAIVSYGVNGSEQTLLGTSTATSQGGSVNLAANGGFTYTPAGNFIGSDAFRYVLTNSGGSASAQVSVTVTPPAPIAVNDSQATTQGTQLNVSAPGVLENDDLNGAVIASYGASSGSEQTTLGAATATAAGGTVRLNADGSFRYDPSGTFTGTDSFKYTVTNAGGTSTATVTILVQTSNAIDFTVTSPGFNYVFTGVSGSNPVLTLTRGRTYRFRINTSAVHPFEILDAPAGSVTNNNISNGTLIFAVPAGPGTYRYHCSLHEFGNVIQTVP